MKKFMVLYMAAGAEFEKMMKNSTPEQRKKGMDVWMKWMNANKASIIEGGAPLGKTKRVDSNGASNTKNEIGGYSVVQAESHDAASKIFRKRPSSSENAGRLDRNYRGDAAAWHGVTNATNLHRGSADSRKSGWQTAQADPPENLLACENGSGADVNAGNKSGGFDLCNPCIAVINYRRMR
jgi:hypothetical protein